MPIQLHIPGFNQAIHYESVSSTMDAARQLLQEAGLIDTDWCGVVTADNQTAGRGRQGRSWLGAERAFMGTFLFCTGQPLAQLVGYSLSVGHAVACAFDSLGANVSLKWPNDLVVVEQGEIKKVGGILIEVEEIGDLRCILVGLGINLSQPPKEVLDRATSLEALGQSRLSASEVTRIVARALLAAHQEFVKGGGLGRVLDVWQRRSCFVKGSTELTVELGDATVTGVYAGISETGALLLTVNGAGRTIHSGHITHIRL
jgi:BirA family biotin operon repressor/biotin-[acetyl-CoA-carboxylase] ligase